MKEVHLDEAEFASHWKNALDLIEEGATLVINRGSLLLRIKDESILPEWMGQSIEDQQHQLKTSSILAMRNSIRLMEKFRSGSLKSEDLRFLVALCSRIQTAVNMTGIFRRLAGKLPIQINSSEVTLDDLARLTAEAVMYMSFRISPEEGKTFNVEVTDLADTPQQFRVKADLNMVAMALDPILDNAVKYSYSNTAILLIVRILPQTMECAITVENTGVSITDNEALRLGVRGGHGNMINSGEGIGLYLSSSILKAMGGRLSVMATDSENRTKVSLVLPIIQVGGKD